MKTKLPNPLKFISKVISFLTGLRSRKNVQSIKPIREILNDECILRKHKKINLDIYNEGIHLIAHFISTYYRVVTGEYIIILDTELGRLVGKDFDSIHAQSEYSFICEEDKIKNEGKDVTVNTFNYTLYDNDLNKMIGSHENSYKSHHSKAA